MVNIQTLEIMRGGLPRRALALVLEWAHEHYWRIGSYASTGKHHAGFRR